MEIVKIIKEIKRLNQNNIKTAVFIDKREDLRFISISKKGVKYDFEVFNKELESIGKLGILDMCKGKVYISVIYTLTSYRDRGIASCLNDALNHLAKENNWNIIYGEFSPQQMGKDRTNNVFCLESTLYKKATIFYQSKGYSLININDFKKYPEKYDVNKDLYSYFENIQRIHGIDVIVYKNISEPIESKFKIKDEVLVHQSVFNYYKKKRTDRNEQSNKKCY